MAANRQGQCDGCSHDVVDPRDLKLFRNVCGFWFRPQDDPFRWRDRVGLARAGLAEVTAACVVASAALAALGVGALVTGQRAVSLGAGVVLVLWYHAVRFFRDPERVAPTDPDALISPSDGIVTDAHEVADDDFPGWRAFRVSIYLSPWDVHLNRNPRDGRVVAVRYFPGRFLNARHPDCAVQNEQLWVDVQEPNGRIVRIKQISGAMARRLVCWLRTDEPVRVGERYGMIKYGSRADVLIPATAKFSLAVRVGDRVSAGETVLLRFAD